MWSVAPPRKTIGAVGDDDDDDDDGDAVLDAVAAVVDANVVADERWEGFARRTRHLHSVRLVHDCSRLDSSHRDRSYYYALSLMPDCPHAADERMNSTAVAVETVVVAD